MRGKRRETPSETNGGIAVHLAFLTDQVLGSFLEMINSSMSDVKYRPVCRPLPDCKNLNTGSRFLESGNAGFREAVHNYPIRAFLILYSVILTLSRFDSAQLPQEAGSVLGR